jgi:hypothetical protein
MTTYREARHRVNLDRFAPERQRDRGWRSLREIADDVGPYLSRLSGAPSIARRSTVAMPGHGVVPVLFSQRPDGHLQHRRRRPRLVSPMGRETRLVDTGRPDLTRDVASGATISGPPDHQVTGNRRGAA